MFTNAQYIRAPFGELSAIKVDINDITSFVPINESNGDYLAIKRLVESGELVIADADVADQIV